VPREQQAGITGERRDHLWQRCYPAEPEALDAREALS
jgi:hypothetical protein